MTLHSRLRSLERETAARPDQRCRTCGHLLHKKRGQVDPTIKYSASFDGTPIEGPEVCPDCGRRLVYRMEFDRGLG